MDKHGTSPMLLNCLAVAKMSLGQFEAAEASLQDALIKSPADADSLANMIIVSYQLGRSKEVINRLSK
jgi:Flp pilus assembly protein TadD